MRRFLPVLFAWWFVWFDNTGSGGFSVNLEGPFVSEIACHKVEKVLETSILTKVHFVKKMELAVNCFSDEVG